MLIEYRTPVTIYQDSGAMHSVLEQSQQPLVITMIEILKLRRATVYKDSYQSNYFNHLIFIYHDTLRTDDICTIHVIIVNYLLCLDML